MSETKENTVERTARKVREGLVVSDKMDKTVVVAVEDRSSTRCTARSCAGPAS
jgi:small subunit ribosomal protein S17